MIDEETIKKAAIKNAATHEGSARVGSVISEMLGKDKNLVNQMGELKIITEKVVKEVNALKKEEILKLATDMNLLSTKEKQPEKKELKPLPNTAKGVVLRLPPEPSGYMHWGHALSFTINYLYKEMYNGTLWLRFEDTNPNLVKEEFVKNFEESIKWLGIKYDKKKFISEDIEKIYEFAKKLIKEGKAYGCTCSPDEIKRDRTLGNECKHRNNSIDENLRLWEEAENGKIGTGEITFRFKGDMKDKDASLRDPNIMRVIKNDYKPYNLWPLYALK